ncbi:MAG: PHP domain-containing protein [Oscillospiraceae bacterium]
MADLHTHTLVSNHAYNTITEMITKAKELGLAAMAVTDHAPALPDSAHPWYFYNLTRLPPVIDGVVLLRGVEMNVLDTKGTLDFTQEELKGYNFDWIVASIHHDAYGHIPTKAEATESWMNIAQNPYVDIIGHSEQYPCCFDTVVKEMMRNNKLIEINANSALVRPGKEENMRCLIRACVDNNAYIAVNSDAHSIYNLAQSSTVAGMLNEVSYPQELIVNTDRKRFINMLQSHNKTAVNYLL